MASSGRELWRFSVSSEEDLEWSEKGLNLPTRICTQMTIHQRRKGKNSEENDSPFNLTTQEHSEGDHI